MTATLGEMSKARKEFSRAMGTIEAKVTGLFGMVAEDLPAATHALLRDPGDAAGTLAERERGRAGVRADEPPADHGDDPGGALL
jgi:hypothetical protein